MSSPYGSHGPRPDAALFFGRAHELNEIGGFLRSNQSVSVIGPRGIGKSSLMLHLMRPETLTALQMQQGHLFVYVDCQAFNSARPDEIFTDLCRQMVAAMRAGDTESRIAPGNAGSGPARLSFEAAVRSLNERGLRVVFMLDDFEALALNPHVDVTLFNALRSAAGRLRLAFVTASAQPLFQLAYFNSSEAMLASPFFNIFAQLFLGLLSETEARTLIRTHMDAAGVVPGSPPLEDFIYQLAGGHPLALQLACNHARAGQADLDTIGQLTTQDLRPHFEHYWRHLSSAEREVLRNPAGATSSEASDPAIRSTLRDLTRKCLLVQVSGSYIYPSKAWADFVVAQSRDPAAESLAERRSI